MECQIWEVYDILKDWFKIRKLSILNIYIAALITIEQLHSKYDVVQKKTLLNDSIHFVLNYLIKEGKLKREDADLAREEIEEEMETLESVRELLFVMTNEPNLLQKDKFVLAERKKILLCKTPSMKSFSIGKIKE